MLKRRPRFTTIVLGLAAASSLIGLVGALRPGAIHIRINRANTLAAITSAGRLYVALIQADPASVRISSSGIGSYADDLANALASVGTDFVSTRRLYDGTWLSCRTWGADAFLISLAICAILGASAIVRSPRRIGIAFAEAWHPTYKRGRVATYVSSAFLLGALLISGLWLLSHLIPLRPLGPPERSDIFPIPENRVPAVTLINYSDGPVNILLTADHGSIAFCWHRLTPSGPRVSTDRFHGHPDSLREIRDIASSSTFRPTRTSFRSITWIGGDLGLFAIGLPISYVVTLFLVWPIIVFVVGPWRRAAERMSGMCMKCGYNLTGLPAPRCPECGTDVRQADSMAIAEHNKPL